MNKIWPFQKLTLDFTDNAYTVAFTGTAESGASTSLTDDDIAGLYPDDYFNGCTLTITAGEGNGETATITDYKRSTGKFTFSGGLSEGSTPDATSQYSVSKDLAISDIALFTDWNCVLKNNTFSKTIYYVYNGQYFRHYFRISQSSDDPPIGNPYPKVYMQTYIDQYTTPPSGTTRRCGITFKADISVEGNIDLDSLEVINYTGSGEDGNTTISSAEREHGSTIISTFRSGNLPTLNMVWAYNDDMQQYMWYHPDDALALDIAGGGRFKRRLIMFGNGKIYFSDIL